MTLNRKYHYFYRKKISMLFQTSNIGFVSTKMKNCENWNKNSIVRLRSPFGLVSPLYLQATAFSNFNIGQRSYAFHLTHVCLKENMGWKRSDKMNLKRINKIQPTLIEAIKWNFHIWKRWGFFLRKNRKASLQSKPQEWTKTQMNSSLIQAKFYHQWNNKWQQNHCYEQWKKVKIMIKSSLKGILLVNFPEKEKDFLIKNLAAENKIPLITQSASLLLKDSRNMNDLLGVDDPIQSLFDKVKTSVPCICVRADYNN